MSSGWLDLAIASLSLLFYSLEWILFFTANTILYVLRLVAWPLAAIWRAILFILAPVTYTARFLLSPLFALIGNYPRLQPLYIYFGSAAFIGITVGIILRLTTATTFAILGLNDDGSSSRNKSRSRNSPYQQGGSAQNTQLSLASQKSNDSRPMTPVTPGGHEQRELDALLAGISSSPESDHLVAALQGGAWRDSPNTKRKRRGLGGSGGGARRFGTILEEDDDSL